MARQETAGTIINRVAVEVGLVAVADPFSTTDKNFTQMTGLLNAAGVELASLHEWNELTKEFTFNTTTDVTDGYADLPDDYDRFIMQTGWDLSNDVAIAGPLTAQQWAYLKGRNLASNSIYVTYRINNNQIEIYPTPPPADVDCSFRYISRYWARTTDATEGDLDYCTQTSDVVLLDPMLMQKFLRVKWLNAKSLPADAARIEFENMWNNRTGVNKGGQILNAGRSPRVFPYLNGFFNTPDTNFGA